MKIIVSNRLGVPIYEQIKAQIKEAIFSGELKEHDWYNNKTGSTVSKLLSGFIKTHIQSRWSGSNR